MKAADLHLHTCYSDGTYSPAELAAHARRQDLSALALTDHDTVEGCEPTAAACRELGLEFIPGTELTAERNGNELHILGYFLDTHHQRLLDELARFQEVRQNRIREMVARLNQHHIPLRAEAVFALANCRSPGRPHVGRALVQGGYCVNLDEAFDRFLKKHRPAWVPKCKISASHAIELVHLAGGLAVMAHPGLNRTDGVIPELVAAGLDGLECFHTKHNHATTEHYLQLAERYHLLVTGGSDCHGLSKGKPLIGSVRLPYVYVERLTARVAQKRSETTPLAAGAVQTAPAAQEPIRPDRDGARDAVHRLADGSMPSLPVGGDAAGQASGTASLGQPPLEPEAHPAPARKAQEGVAPESGSAPSLSHPS